MKLQEVKRLAGQLRELVRGYEEEQALVELLGEGGAGDFVTALDLIVEA